MVVVTHEMGFAREVATRVMFMDERKLRGGSAAPGVFYQPEERAPSVLPEQGAVTSGDIPGSDKKRRCREKCLCSGVSCPSC